jgi:hypothetical protein
MSRFSDLIEESIVEAPSPAAPTAPSPVAASSSESKAIGYNPNATDRDGDGLVQEGTPFERSVSPSTSKKKK